MTSYTSSLTLQLQTPGDPAVANVWGTNLNTNFTLIDTAIGGTLVLDVSGAANVVLTVANGAPDQARNANFLFTGTLTGDILVLWPNGGGSFAVRNSTTGAFTLGCAVNNGSGGAEGAVVNVPQGGAVAIATGATDASLRVDATGIGAVGGGPNSSITSITGLTTPLAINQGGTGSATNNVFDAAGAAAAALDTAQGDIAALPNGSRSNITISASAPSGGGNIGDVWYQI